MNTIVTASRVIDRAILLEEGGAIVIPCSSYEEMENLRTRLYKLKTQLAKNYREVALSLDIKRKVSTNKWVLFVTKDSSLSGVFIVEGGEAKPFDDIKGFEETEETEEKRKEEEIEEEVKDFDDIATEMEITQGLLSKDEEETKIDVSEKEVE